MKIIIITPDPEGGIYHYSIELCKSLSARAIDVVLITSKGHEFEENSYDFDIVELFNFRRHKFFSIGLIRKLGIRKVYNAIQYILSLAQIVRFGRENKPDLIHVQGLFGSMMGLITINLLSNLINAPIVDTVHNVSQRRRFIGYKLVSNMTLRSINLIIVHSNHAKNNFLLLYRINSERIKVIPHGNYLFFNSNNLVDKEHARKILTIDGKSKVLLFFGFIKPYKGLEILLQSIPRILSAIPNLILLIAGQSIEGFARYDDIVQNLGIDNFIVKHLSYIPTEKVHIYFVAADVVVQPYLNEVAIDQSGVAQLAYAFSKPLIVSDVGGISEVVINNKTGIKVQPGNVTELASAVIDLLGDMERACRIGQEGNRFAKMEFGWEKIASLHFNSYLSLLTDNKLSSKYSTASFGNSKYGK